MTTLIHTRFIDSQLRLEADAREALPYVSGPIIFPVQRDR
jgi:hypothetical protein